MPTRCKPNREAHPKIASSRRHRGCASNRAQPGAGSICSSSFQKAVDRGHRGFWLRRGIDVDSGRVNDI